MEPAAASMLLILGLFSAVGTLAVLLVRSNKKLQKSNEKTRSSKDSRGKTDQEKLIKKQEKMLFRNKILVNVLSKNFRNEKKQLDYVLHEALKLTESKVGYICFYNEKKQEFTLKTWSKGMIKEVEVPKLIYRLEEAGGMG